MFIDVNAYLGHWPFRQLRHNTVDELLSLMDAKDIARAAVSSASAILHRNPQPANQELSAQAGPHNDRFIPMAVINPTYAAWERDLAECVAELGFRGLRLYPGYHNYSLADPCCDDLVSAAVDYGLVVSIPIRAVDHRQRHWLVDVPDLSLEDVTALLRRHADGSFILLNGIGYTNSPLASDEADAPGNFVIEISRLSALLRSEIRVLLDRLGSRRLVFGSGMPFKYVDPAQLKLEVLSATPPTKERIAWRNAADLFSLDHGPVDAETME